jgi:hypothetical protein
MREGEFPPAVPAGVAAILAYTLFILVQGDGVHLPIVDELESWTAYYHAMTLRDLFAPHGATIDAIANAPRVNFGSEFNVPILLHVLLPPVKAYALVEMLAKFTAFFGMYLLLTRDLRIADRTVAAAGALIFAFALVHHYALFAVSALPLVAHAWLWILEKEERPWHIAVLLAFPFFSSIPFAFATYLMLVVLGGWHLIRGRRIRARALAVLAGMVLVAIAVDWRLFAEKFFAPTFVFHRGEFANAYSFDAAWARFLASLNGAGHEASIRPLPFIALSVAGYTLFSVWRKPVDWKPLLAAAAGVAILFVASFVNHPLFVFVTDRALGLGDFSFERLDYLAVPAFAIAFALALAGFVQRLPEPAWLARVLAVGGLAVIQAAYLVRLSPPLFEWRIGTPTVAEFYAPDAFEEIREAIGLPREEYRVLSLGILPSVAIYNGFRTADGYFSLYELRYKHAFRAVIAGELAKSEPLRRSFDEWGNRLYVPAAELGDWPYGSRALRDHGPITVALDTNAATRLDAWYVISAVPIANADLLALNMLHVVESDGSLYRLYVYGIGGRQGVP